MVNQAQDLFGGFASQGQYGGYQALLGGSGEGLTPLSSVKSKYLFGDFNTPQLFAQFAQGQLAPEGAISQAAEARRRGIIEGGAGSFAEAQRQANAESRYAGTPGYIARRRSEQLFPLYQSQVAQGLASSDAQQQEDIFNLLSSTVSSIASATEFQTGLSFQKYQIKKAEEAAKRANKFKAIGSVISAGLGALTGGLGFLPGVSGGFGGALAGATASTIPYSTANLFGSGY